MQRLYDAESEEQDNFTFFLSSSYLLLTRSLSAPCISSLYRQGENRALVGEKREKEQLFVGGIKFLLILTNIAINFDWLDKINSLSFEV